MTDRTATRIRPAAEDDAAGMLAIYGPVVETTAISFESEVPSIEEFRQRIRSGQDVAPWLVCEMDGLVAGYVYGSHFRPRAAYRWSAEVTVYVNDQFRRRRVGRALYESLIACLRFQGFRRAIAAITLPNDASVGLHESIGFKQAGVFPSFGHKFDTWHDLGWWQMDLGGSDDSPSVPLSVTMAAGMAGWPEAVESGLDVVHQT